MANATALALVDRAESTGRVLPPLLVEAQRVAATVILGDHGRKRAGPGESFWQYRPYSFGDSTQRIDWHKSARSDRVFIRENEWEAANTLWLWVSPNPSMTFRSSLADSNKSDRASVMALAIAVLAAQAHERIGVLGAPFSPDHSRNNLFRVAEWFEEGHGEHLPRAAKLPRFSSALLVSDFYEPLEEISAAFSPLAAAGVTGHVLQVTDPAEELLPYTGRVEFEEMAGPLRFLASKTETLREPYAEKFSAHRAGLSEICRRLGWSFTPHRTDAPPSALLIALHARISGSKLR